MGSKCKLNPDKKEEMKWLWIKNYPNPDYTYDKLSKIYKISRARILQIAHDEKWRDQRSKFLEEKSKSIRKRMVEMFTDAELPPERLIKLIAQGAINTPGYRDIKSVNYSTTENVTKDGKKVKKKVPKSVTVTIDDATDNATTSFYRKLASELMDLEPTQRKSIEEESQEEGRIPVKTHL